MHLDQLNGTTSAFKPSFTTVVSEKIKAFSRSKPRLKAAITLARFVVRTQTGPVLLCPVCNESHHFLVAGSPPRLNAACPSCGALERHRLLAHYLKQFPKVTRDKSILHFAPEESLRRLVAQQAPGAYVTADLAPDRGDIQLSIENITLAERFDVIIVSHVLEHVNDRVALQELYKALKPGGLAVIMVPIVEGWASTYENNDVTTNAGRLRHFGQEDHVRIYGRDLRDRIRTAGFDLEEYAATPAECLSMGLVPGETIFLARKTDDKSVGSP
jgi:SAM-dependent methyltransferase